MVWYHICMTPPPLHTHTHLFLTSCRIPPHSHQAWYHISTTPKKTGTPMSSLSSSIVLLSVMVASPGWSRLTFDTGNVLGVKTKFASCQIHSQRQLKVKDTQKQNSRQSAGLKMLTGSHRPILSSVPLTPRNLILARESLERFGKQFVFSQTDVYLKHSLKSIITWPYADL